MLNFDDLVDLSSWVEEIIYPHVLMVVSTSLFLLFYCCLFKMLMAERQTSQALDHAQSRLEEYNWTLEEKVSLRTVELAI